MSRACWRCWLAMIGLMAMASAESVHREVLDNGLVLVVEEFHQTSAAEVRVAVRAGPVNEGPLLGSGASLLLQRVLVNSGIGGQGVDEVRRAIARMGNRFYSDTTVATAVYGMSVTGDQTAEALGLLVGLLGNFHYTQADLQREREAILAQANVAGEAFSEQLLNSVVYRQHPARLPVAGVPAMMEQVTLDLLRRYHAARYTAANTVVTVVGNVNTNDIRRQVTQAFAHYAVGGYQPSLLYAEPNQVGPRYASGQAEVALPRVTMAWRTESAEHAAQPALAVLTKVLGDNVLPEAFAAAKVDCPVQVELRAPVDQPGVLLVAFSTALARADAERAIYAALAGLATHGPTADAVVAAKRRLRRDAAVRLESARMRAEDLERWELATGDPRYAALYAAAVDAVTPEDVAAIVQRYCGNGAFKTCTVVMHSAGDTDLDIPGKAAEPASRVAPALVELTGGVRLLAHPPADTAVMHLMLTFGGALSAEEPTLSGSAAVLAAMLSYRGLPAGLDLAARCDHDGLSLMITCLSDDADQALTALSDLLTRPTLDMATLDLVRGDVLRRIDAAANDRQGQLIAASRAVVAADDAMGRPVLGSKEVVARLDVGAIAALWKRLAVTGNVVVSVAGHYEQGAVTAALNGLLSARPPIAVGSAPAPPPRGASATIPPLTVMYHDGPGAAVACAWNIPARGQAVADEAPVAVLAALLAGVDAPGGRLQMALAAMPGSPHASALAVVDARSGVLILHSTVDPTAVDAVTTTIREQVAHLLSQLSLADADPLALSAVELATAKQICLTSLALQSENVIEVAGRAAIALIEGGDPGRFCDAPARIAAVTPAELLRVARAWLSVDPVVVIDKPRTRDGAATRTSAERGR